VCHKVLTWLKEIGPAGFFAVVGPSTKALRDAPSPPSPRSRGEGRDEGALPPGSDARARPLTRIAAQSDLSPHDGELVVSGKFAAPQMLSRIGERGCQNFDAVVKLTPEPKN
jgi:hypothetical protein